MIHRFSQDHLAARSMESISGRKDEHGTVYYLDDYPFLQVHLFTDAYTICWPSSAEGNRVIVLAAHLVEQGVHQGWKRCGWESLRSGQVSLVKVKAEGLIEVKEDFGGPELAPDSFPQHVERVLKDGWHHAISVHVELSAEPDSTAVFAFWTDTLRAELVRPETGLTASYGVTPVQSLRDLLIETSPSMRDTSTEKVDEFLTMVNDAHQLGSQHTH